MRKPFASFANGAWRIYYHDHAISLRLEGKLILQVQSAQYQCLMVLLVLHLQVDSLRLPEDFDRQQGDSDHQWAKDRMVKDQ